MRNALGQPQRIAVVGGTSEIAQSAVRSLVANGGIEHVLLTARRVGDLALFQAELHESEVAPRSLHWDACGTQEDHDTLVAALFASGDVDVLIVAAGQLPDQEFVEDAPAAFAVVNQVNFTAPAGILLRAATRMRAQGHGTIVVLSSVAAERPRADNYVYGSTKAGLDAFATGLGDRLHGSGVSVVVVRPGMVRTRMTTGMEEAPMTVEPAEVGATIAAAVLDGTTRTVWAPAPLQFVMAGLRHLPRPVFRKLAAAR